MSTTATTGTDVAEYLTADPETTCRMASCGDLSGFNVGGNWRLQQEDLDDCIPKQEQTAAKNRGEDR